MSRRNFGRIGKSITPSAKLTITPKMGFVGLNDIAYNSLPFWPMSATGGTVTTDGDYKIHTFTSSGVFTVTTAGGSLESVIAVGGGGGGGAAYWSGGGGGGGGLGYKANVPVIFGNLLYKLAGAGLDLLLIKAA